MNDIYYIIIAGIVGVFAICAIAASLWELSDRKKDELEEMTWFPLDEDGRA